MNNPVLTAVDVRKTFISGDRRIEVLRGAALSVHAGESVSISGESGSGKSTLLQLLARLDEPDTGSITWGGSAERADYLGMVFQSFYLIPEMDALANVLMAARIRGAVGKAEKARAAELLARVGLAERATHLPAQLSGGERQRVAVARALATTTDVAMLQLLWVTWVAQYAGQRWAIICTVNSVLLLNFLFVEPYYTLFVHQGDYLITFIVMLLLGIFIGRISGRLRLELARAKKHMRQRQLLSGKTRQAKMRAELEHSRAMMLRSISHDLRTPLATIMGASSMLADKDLPLSEAQIREQANNIYRQSTLLSQHFDKVMELSRVQQPQSSMLLEPVAVSEVISAAIARRAALLAEQPFTMQLATPDCVADATLLEIALANMLENAVKHGQQPIRIEFAQQDNQFSLSVTNATTGQPPPAGNAQRDSGTGLGTAICRAVMHLHNGSFSAVNDIAAECFVARLHWPSPVIKGAQLG